MTSGVAIPEGEPHIPSSRITQGPHVNDTVAGVSPHEEAPAVIRVEDVSKQFIRRTGQVGDLRERFAEWRNEWKRKREPAADATDATFWALRDVSFQIRKGESFGIVGHNGSGKSTLLKMLTGILEPTHGRVAITGRVGALIEVGAGFHPDLSGRENIFLNGSILGLSRRDIEERFDRIVRFAGLEEFIDTPVKRYSSGMYMRLGFAVAAHTDPDILLIDEVLAVGDMQFQRKCIRHLQEFRARGGTLIFVSHGMDQMRQVCDTCVWLDHGQVRFIGPTEQAVGQYVSMVTQLEDDEFRRNYPVEWEAQQAEKAAEESDTRRAMAQQEQARLAARQENESRHQARVLDPSLASITGAKLLDAQGNPVSQVASGDPITMSISYHVPAERENLIVGAEIFRDDGLYVWSASNYDYEVALPVPSGDGEIRFGITTLALTAGNYCLRVSLFAEPNVPGWDHAPEDVVEAATSFTVTRSFPAVGSVALLVNNWKALPFQKTL